MKKLVLRGYRGTYLRKGERTEEGVPPFAVPFSFFPGEGFDLLCVFAASRETVLGFSFVQFVHSCNSRSYS